MTKNNAKKNCSQQILEGIFLINFNNKVSWQQSYPVFNQNTSFQIQKHEQKSSWLEHQPWYYIPWITTFYHKFDRYVIFSIKPEITEMPKANKGSENSSFCSYMW